MNIKITKESWEIIAADQVEIGMQIRFSDKNYDHSGIVTAIELLEGGIAYISLEEGNTFVMRIFDQVEFLMKYTKYVGFWKWLWIKIKEESKC